MLAAAPLLPDALAAAASGLLALLLLGRFSMWHPHRALARIDVGIMFLGGAAIIARNRCTTSLGTPDCVRSIPFWAQTVRVNPGRLLPALVDPWKMR